MLTSMAADATTILSAVKAVLVGLYPAIPVRISKRPATVGKNAKSGWQAGYPSTCFVISCDGGEEIDRVPSFIYVSVGYPVVIEYIKPAQATVVGAVDTGAPTVIEDPDVREKRAALRAAFYKPTLAGAPTVYDVRYEKRSVYQEPTEAGATILVSAESYVWTTTEPRQH